jgi:uncharacterized membrane protein YfcA
LRRPKETTSSASFFIAVLVGGQIGSRLSIHQKVSPSLIQRATAILILSIAFKLLMKFF